MLQNLIIRKKSLSFYIIICISLNQNVHKHSKDFVVSVSLIFFAIKILVYQFNLNSYRLINAYSPIIASNHYFNL